MTIIANDQIEPPQLPPGARAYMDIAHGAHERQRYDLFLPPGRGAGAPPLVVYIHGGSWRSRNKSAVRVWYLLEHGYALASLGYRLSQHATFPAQIRDVNAALADLSRRAAEFGISARRIAIVGLSAGGHLAALAGLARGRPEFGDAGPAEIAGVLDFYAVSDIRALSDPANDSRDRNAADSAISQLLGARPGTRPDLADRASPISHVHPGAPPFLLVHGEADPLVPIAQSELLHRRLRETGVPTRLLRVPDAGHAGPRFNAPDVCDAVLDFLAGLDLRAGTGA